MAEIKFYRGAEAGIPALSEGEPGFCLDTGQLYVGGPHGRVPITHYITPEAYGAVGDGIADDYIPLQASINASSIGKPTIIKDRVYRSSLPLTIDTDFNSLKGVGIKSVIWGDHAGYALQCGNNPPADTTEGVCLEDLHLWSALGSGLMVTNTNKSKFRNIWSWSAGNGFTIQELSIINIFENLYYSSNLYVAMRLLYPVLPALASIGIGISVIRPTMESNALTFISPLIEGAGSHGISVTGTHINMVFLNPCSEGNGGWGYFFDGVTGNNTGLSLLGAYGEANALGALYAKKQHNMTIHNGFLSPGVGQNVSLVEVANSSFMNIVCRDFTEDAASSDNFFMGIAVAGAATYLGEAPSFHDLDCDRLVRSTGMFSHLKAKAGISMFWEAGANTGNISVYDDVAAAYKSLCLTALKTDIKIASGVTKFLMTASGLIGINDPAPAEQLDVGGNINVTGGYKVADVALAQANIVGLTLADGPTFDHLHVTNNADFGGNIGIKLPVGMTNPRCLVDISSPSVDGAVVLLDGTSQTQGNRSALLMAPRNVSCHSGNVSIEGISVNNQQAELVLRTGGTTINTFGTERIRITTEGNVGINDTAPSEKLDVTGNINATGVFKVADVQVVGARVIDARVDDTINTVAWDATTAGVLDALRDAMILHGLIEVAGTKSGAGAIAASSAVTGAGTVT